MPLVATLMLTPHSTVFACNTIGVVCTPTSNPCAMPAQVVPLQTQKRASPPNWCTIFPSKRHSLFYSSTPTLLKKHSSFDGFEVYLVACCGITGFAFMEPIPHANSKNFALAIICIQLHYGFCHTIVFDKDSKFYSVCREALNLVYINCHVLSGDNHNPMMDERVNRYLTKGLKLMTNECYSVRVALKAILLLLYAWNSCLIPGTDISHSLVTVGHEFAFPIDYSTNKHWELTSSPSSVESYSGDLATCLSTLCEVAHHLVQEQRAYHCKLINSRRPDPASIPLAMLSLLDALSVQMLQKATLTNFKNAFTGPWRITAILKGALYKLKHCSTPNCKDKKHASNLSLYPLELIPFKPVDGSHTQNGQLNKPIQASPYKEAGIKGFKPLLPFKVPANYLRTDSALAFYWPSLSELNNNVAPFQWLSEDERHLYLSGDTISNLPVMYLGPLPAAPTYPPPAIPELTFLT